MNRQFLASNPLQVWTVYYTIDTGSASTIHSHGNNCTSQMRPKLAALATKTGVGVAKLWRIFFKHLRTLDATKLFFPISSPASQPFHDTVAVTTQKVRTGGLLMIDIHCVLCPCAVCWFGARNKGALYLLAMSFSAKMIHFSFSFLGCDDIRSIERVFGKRVQSGIKFSTARGKNWGYPAHTRIRTNRSMNALRVKPGSHV